MSRTSNRRSQAGMFLIEVIVAMLIFMLGILALLGVSGVAVSAQSDAQYRTDAAQLAAEISQAIWVGVDRSSTAVQLRASLVGFQHQPTGDEASCDYSGAASTNDAVTNWVTAVTTPPTDASQAKRNLPGSTTAMQQIKVDDTTNQVTINICWKAPSDLAPRRYVLVTVVN